MSGHRNPTLIPKTVTDVHGHIKTVWVKPDTSEAGGGLPDVPPTLPNYDYRGQVFEPIGQQQASLLHTKEERLISAERKYGSDALSDAAHRKFEAKFGVTVEDAPPVEMNDERMYDYLAEGLSVGQAYEYALYGLEPHLAHPKLDAEYIFVSDEKVAKLDLKRQKESDSYIRTQELRSIKVTARVLQMDEVDPLVAAECLANGLRKSHLNNKFHSLADIVEMSRKHNVESKEFKEFMATRPTGDQPNPDSWFVRQRRKMGIRMRRAAMRSLRRRGRRMYNAVSRRWNRFLKLAFVPWKTR